MTDRDYEPEWEPIEEEPPKPEPPKPVRIPPSYSSKVEQTQFQNQKLRDEYDATH